MNIYRNLWGGGTSMYMSGRVMCIMTYLLGGEGQMPPCVPPPPPPPGLSLKGLAKTEVLSYIVPGMQVATSLNVEVAPV